MSYDSVTHKKLTEYKPGEEAPQFFVLGQQLYVQVEWLCDRMNYTPRGEARTSWRKEALFAVSAGNCQMRYIEAEAALRRLGRATLYGQNGDSARDEYTSLYNQLEYVAFSHGVQFSTMAPQQTW